MVNGTKRKAYPSGTRKVLSMFKIRAESRVLVSRHYVQEVNISISPSAGSLSRLSVHHVQKIRTIHAAYPYEKSNISNLAEIGTLVDQS